MVAATVAAAHFNVRLRSWLIVSENWSMSINGSASSIADCLQEPGGRACACGAGSKAVRQDGQTKS